MAGNGRGKPEEPGWRVVWLGDKCQSGAKRNRPLSGVATGFRKRFGTAALDHSAASPDNAADDMQLGQAILGHHNLAIFKVMAVALTCIGLHLVTGRCIA